MGRDWSLLAESKAEAWRASSGATPSERVRVVDELREFARRTVTDWPQDSERAADLAMHERLAELLRACPNHLAR